MAAAVPLVASVIATAVAKHESDKAQAQQKQISKQQQDIANQAIPFGKQFMGQAQEALSPTLSYYTSLLSGNRALTQATMAPELNNIAHQYAGRAAATSGLYPRGGATPSAAENVRNQYSSDVNNTLFQARPMAAQALGGLGTNLANLGFQGYGLGSGVLNNVFSQGLAARNQQFQQGSALGGGIFNAYQAYLLNRANNPSGGGNTTTIPTGQDWGSTFGGSMPGVQPNSTTSTSGGLYGGNLPNSGSSGAM